jgi:hypothetical protein
MKTHGNNGGVVLSNKHNAIRCGSISRLTAESNKLRTDAWVVTKWIKTIKTAKEREKSAGCNKFTQEYVGLFDKFPPTSFTSYTRNVYIDTRMLKHYSDC